jgi:hypothetical protein
MFIYEIILAVMLALFLSAGIAWGMLYQLIYIYLIARLATEVIRFYLAYHTGDPVLAKFHSLNLSYWLPNLVRSGFFLLLMYFVLDRFLPMQLSESAAFKIQLQMYALPIISIILLWIPTSRANWPQFIVMATFSIVLLGLIFMQAKKQFKHAVILSSPFTKPSIVVSAGFSPLYNHHFFFSSQRFAADLVLTDYNRQAHQIGELTAFTSFGEALIAPVSGEVVGVDAGHIDQPLKQRDFEQPVGNHIVIKTRDNLFVLLAHLKQGSVSLNVGDYVKQGEKIAELGNSGNSSEPHLHIQVQNNANFEKVTQTYPIYFKSQEGLQFARTKQIINGGP